MAAALAGAAEVATFLREFCHSPTPCCEIDPDTKEVKCECDPKSLRENSISDYEDRLECASFSGLVLKILSTAAQSAGQAEGQCPFPVPDMCGQAKLCR